MGDKTFAEVDAPVGVRREVLEEARTSNRLRESHIQTGMCFVEDRKHGTPFIFIAHHSLSHSGDPNKNADHHLRRIDKPIKDH
jgi:hypothetical protein